MEEGIRLFPWDVRERRGGREALWVPWEVALLEGGPAAWEAYMEGKLRFCSGYDEAELQEVWEGETNKSEGGEGWR